jgi:hypothetical protein
MKITVSVLFLWTQKEKNRKFLKKITTFSNFLVHVIHFKDDNLILARRHVPDRSRVPDIFGLLHPEL